MSEKLETTFKRLMENSDLEPRQREFFEFRYLDQLTWMEGKARTAQRSYYRLRVVTIIGAVVVPALVSLNTLNGWHGTAAQIAAWIVSLVVAISAAIEGFFQFGQRWRNYRATAEQLKSEGWRFFEGAEPYGSSNGSLASVFGTFAHNVEDLFRKEVDTYITKVVADKHQSGS